MKHWRSVSDTASKLKAPTVAVATPSSRLRGRPWRKETGTGTISTHPPHAADLVRRLAVIANYKKRVADQRVADQLEEDT